MTTHQTASPRPRRRLAAALLLPLLLVLGGCFRLDMGLTINDDDTVDMSMDVGDITGMMSREDMDCSALESEIADAPEEMDVTIEETETDGNVGCQITAAGAPLDTFDDDAMSITRDGDNYVFSFTGDEAQDMDELGDMPDGMQPQISISVTFPGSVVEADDNAEIDGNTVTWSGMEAFSTGGNATGEATGSGIGGSSNTVLWIIIGVVALVAIAALIFFIVKRNQSSGAGAAAGVPGQPGPGAPGQPFTPGVPGAPGVPGQAPGQPPVQGAPGAPGQPPAPGQAPGAPGVPGQPPAQGYPGQAPGAPGAPEQPPAPPEAPGNPPADGGPR